MKLTQKCFGNISKMLDFYSQFNPSPLSIKQFIDFGECEELAFIGNFTHLIQFWASSVERRSRLYLLLPTPRFLFLFSRVVV